MCLFPAQVGGGFRELAPHVSCGGAYAHASTAARGVVTAHAWVGHDAAPGLDLPPEFRWLRLARALVGGAGGRRGWDSAHYAKGKGARPRQKVDAAFDDDARKAAYDGFVEALRRAVAPGAFPVDRLAAGSAAPASRGSVVLLNREPDDGRVLEPKHAREVVVVARRMFQKLARRGESDGAPDVVALTTRAGAAAVAAALANASVVVGPHGAQNGNVALFAPVGACLLELLPSHYARRGAAVEYARVAELALQRHVPLTRGVASTGTAFRRSQRDVGLRDPAAVARAVVRAWQAARSPEGLDAAAARLAELADRRKRVPAPPRGDRKSVV